MDNELIKTLIAALEASTLSELEYSRDGVALRLVKRARMARQPAPEVIPARPASAPARPESPSLPPDTVVAPLFGVVHLRRTSDAPPLVTVGQSVLAGQVLCLIEAMKVFTELRAERDGTIAAVLVESGQDVEAGQAIVRWE